MENKLKELQSTNRLLKLKLMALPDDMDIDNPSPRGVSEAAGTGLYELSGSG